MSPIAYVVLTGFLLLGGWFFFNLLARFNFLLQIYSSMRNPEAQMRLNLNEFVIAPLLHNLSVVLVILVPVITMRSFAEEKRSGTYELLMTSPLSITEIVAGKFLGAVAFLLIMIGLTGDLPDHPDGLRQPRDRHHGLAAIFGLLLLAIAFVDRRLADLVVHREPDHRGGDLPGVAAAALRHRLAGRYRRAECMGAVLKYLSLTEHFGEMVKGIIDTKDLVYFVSVILLSLFLTHRSVESVRWR